MKILYISFYFAPYNHISSVRATKLTKYLHRMGQDIRVVSASEQPLPDDLPLEIPEDKVIYSEWRNINAPFKFLTGKQNQVAQNRSYLSEKQKKKLWIKKLVRLYKYLLYFPDDKVGWIWPAYNKIKKLFQTWRPDMVYVSGGPFSGFILGSLLYRKYKIPWVAEYRDLWAQGHQYPYGNIRKKIERKLENRIVSSAQNFVTVSAALSKQLEDRFNKEAYIINNAFDEEDRIQFSNPERLFSKDKLNIVYTGQIYIEKQGLTQLFEAIQQSRYLKENVLLHFYGPNLKAKIRNNYDKKMLADIVSSLRFYGLVDHDRALHAQESADILLLLGWTDKNFGGVLTGKLFEYLGARKQILALNSYLDDASKIVVDNNSGFFCRNANELVLILKKLLALKQDEGEINGPSLNTEKFSYKVKAKQLLKVLHNVEHRAKRK